MSAGRARAEDGAELVWWSTGSGEPLLLVAGQAVGHRSWDPVLPALAAHHRVLTFDHRGIGRSTTGSTGRPTTRDLARDAVAVLDAAGVGRAHVLGHSMGGRVAQWLAVDHPERVGALVLAATSGGDARTAPRPADVTRALLSGDPARVAPLFFTDAFAASHPAEAAGVFTAGGDRAARLLHARASRGHDAWDVLGRVVAPTLVQHGADDPVTAVEHAELLAAAVPGAVLDVRPGLRHGYHVESADAVDAVLGFLAEHPLTTGVSDPR
ncbi:alpha/beta fold hydrolase [Microlunatus capsulatus]|uniref:Pimeloyl-ACP methyl ester carboxylesterase n=1 Tax=Microlunatus capsulatus TaxID=99117 RepID=A0ABS4Z6H4_9ACTN|nr:alpha/beta fold hydrolase [Microlunatus capsulatus]MBP2416649.1 pimeloyl-ACP methyl ester carboxylesterase [Microlunatus capsulatus]